MADLASPCSAEKRRLRPASFDRIHHAPRMHCMLTSTGQPHHSVYPSIRCSTAPTARTAVFVCNESAKLRYAPWCWPSSLSVTAFPLSPANPSFGRGRGNLAVSMSRDSPPVRGGSFLSSRGSCSSSGSARSTSSASCASPTLYCTSGYRRSRSRCCWSDAGLCWGRARVSRRRHLPAFGSSGVSRGNRYSTAWLRLLPSPRVTF